MPKKGKIKIFLEAYVDFVNAQNLTARALTHYLNPERYEIYTMLLSPSKEFSREPGVHYFQCRRPARYWRLLGYFWGILHCDIAFLEKREHTRFALFWCRLLRKKFFSTEEGVFLPPLTSAQLEFTREVSPHIFAISGYMRDANRRLHGYPTADRVLYLGVDGEKFAPALPRSAPALRRIVFAGYDIRRKRIEEFLRLAGEPGMESIQFHVVGRPDYVPGITTLEYIKSMGVGNVTFHGLLSYERWIDLLKTMDLFFFPSRNEGFPKVTLEAAYAGVPGIFYGDYGAREWITSGVDGFVIDDYEEAKSIVEDLKANPEKLTSLSEHAIAMAQRFDWKLVISNWEKAIEEMAEE